MSNNSQAQPIFVIWMMLITSGCSQPTMLFSPRWEEQTTLFTLGSHSQCGGLHPDILTL